MVYRSFAQYLSASVNTYAERLAKCNEIITTLENSMIDAATNGRIASYSLDSGQSKVQTNYRSVADIKRDIRAMEQLKSYYEQKVFGTRAVTARGNTIAGHLLGRVL